MGLYFKKIEEIKYGLENVDIVYSIWKKCCVDGKSADSVDPVSGPQVSLQ